MSDRERETAFKQAFDKAYTMSQLYVKNRPPPIPLTEYEARRKKRDLEDILAAARKRGKPAEEVQANLAKLESILPDLINLNKMRAVDWVTLAYDVDGVAQKMITLKGAYPSANVFALIASRPKTLLQKEADILDNAARVKQLLAGAENPDTIIQAVPELTDATTLVRSLAFLRTAFPSQDPVKLLQENPKLLLNLGESNVEDSAEYGEMTTKD